MVEPSLPGGLWGTVCAIIPGGLLSETCKVLQRDFRCFLPRFPTASVCMCMLKKKTKNRKIALSLLRTKQTSQTLVVLLVLMEKSEVLHRWHGDGWQSTTSFTALLTGLLTWTNWAVQLKINLQLITFVSCFWYSRKSCRGVLPLRELN